MESVMTTKKKNVITNICSTHFSDNAGKWIGMLTMQMVLVRALLIWGKL